MAFKPSQREPSCEACEHDEGSIACIGCDLAKPEKLDVCDWCYERRYACNRNLRGRTHNKCVGFVFDEHIARPVHGTKQWKLCGVTFRDKNEMIGHLNRINSRIGVGHLMVPYEEL